MIEFIQSFVLHLDQSLPLFFETYGLWIYPTLFVIVFAETGLVIFPFLPGDSLLFAVGVLASLSHINVFTVVILLILAANLGDTVNYAMGHFFGRKMLESRFLKRDAFEKAQRYFHKHGPISVVLARFIPFMRTFVPFIAGVSKMGFRTFIIYSVMGAAIWVFLFVSLGYYLAELPWKAYLAL